MFCPQCESEYRPGFTRCSECNVMLVYRLAEVDSDVDPDMELVRLRSFSNDVDAFLAKSVLEAAGIESMVSLPKQNVALPRMFGVLSGTDLYVRSADAVDADEILIKAVRE
jgi:hypothetical protein